MAAAVILNWSTWQMETKAQRPTVRETVEKATDGQRQPFSIPQNEQIVS